MIRALETIGTGFLLGFFLSYLGTGYATWYLSGDRRPSRFFAWWRSR